MSLEIDEAHPWRSKVFAGIKAKYITITPSRRDFDPCEPPEDYAAGPQGVDDWLAATDEWCPARGEARVALGNRKLRAVMEVGDINDRCGLSSEVVVESDLDYSYFSKQTRLEATTDGYHYRAAPALSEAAVNSMLHAQSVEEYAKAAGFKLPRITATDTGAGNLNPLGDGTTEGGGMMVNRFEALRGVVGEHASQDDYGHRLHSLARIVLHAVVVREAAQKNSERSTMSEKQHMRSVLTAALPLIPQDTFRRTSWWYLGSELAPQYRAFLIMGARGLHHYASVDTVYAGLLSEPEVHLPSVTPIVFSRKTGQLTDQQVAPDVAHYLQVLNNPELALSYYNAYARSIGLVHQAAEILLQTAVGPFVWNETATLPYRSVGPKMDGAAYLLAENETRSHLNLLSVERIVCAAAVLGKGYLAGMASMIGGFKRNGKVRVDEVLSRVVGALSDGVQARALGAEVWAHLAGVTSALEWVHPFDNVQVGVTNCIRAFREAGWLLAWYKCVPSEALRGVFDKGVPMSDAVFGESDYRGEHYKELVIYQLAQGKPLQLMSESYAQAVLTPQEYQTLGRMKSWVAVCRPVRFMSRETDTLQEVSGTKKPPSKSKSETTSDEYEMSASLQFLRGVPATDTGSVVTAKPAAERVPSTPAKQKDVKSVASSSPSPPKSVLSNGSNNKSRSTPSQNSPSGNNQRRSSPSQASVSVTGVAI